MELSRPPLVVAFELSERRKAIVADALAGASVVIYLTELDGTARAEALRNAGALLTHNTAKDLRSGEAALLHSARLIQFTIAGVEGQPPVLTSSNPISTLLQRFACARLSQPCLSESCPDFSATFTTIAFDDSSLRWLEINT